MSVLMKSLWATYCCFSKQRCWLRLTCCNHKTSFLACKCTLNSSDCIAVSLGKQCVGSWHPFMQGSSHKDCRSSSHFPSPSAVPFNPRKVDCLTPWYLHGIIATRVSKQQWKRGWNHFLLPLPSEAAPLIKEAEKEVFIPPPCCSPLITVAVTPWKCCTLKNQPSHGQKRLLGKG